MQCACASVRPCHVNVFTCVCLNRVYMRFIIVARVRTHRLSVPLMYTACERNVCTRRDVCAHLFANLLTTYPRGPCVRVATTLTYIHTHTHTLNRHAKKAATAAAATLRTGLNGSCLSRAESINH